jgi:hypothetical protein
VHFTEFPLAAQESLNVLRIAALRDPRNLEHVIRAIDAYWKNLRGLESRFCAHVIASLIKRAWFDEAVTAEIVGKALRFEALEKDLEFFSAMVEEFSALQSSQLGMCWEFHFRAHREFEERVMKALFAKVCEVLGNYQTVGVNAAKYALSVMNAVFSWNFVEFASKKRILFLVRRDSLEDIFASGSMIKPGPFWSDYFLDPQLLGLVWSIYPRVKGLDVEGRLIRNILTQLCSITGSIFANEDSKKNFFHGLIQLVIQISLQLDFQNAQEVLDICGIYQRIISNFGILMISGDQTCGQAFIESLGKIILNLLQQSHVFDSAVDTWYSEGFDSAIDALVTLVGSCEHDRFKIPSNFMEIITQICSIVVPTFVEKVILNAYSNYNEDEGQFHDAEYLDDRLNAISYLGRVNSVESLGLLSKLIVDYTNRIREYATRKAHNLPSDSKLEFIQESLFWLIKMMGFVLADSSEGEHPVVPSLLRLSERNLTILGLKLPIQFFHMLL